ncbi:MAG: NADH-quinone oxidoreductase subunit J, partial [Planctomycetota bacterium JB042]
LVYAGAIMVIFLFVIMLLNLENDPFEEPHVPRLLGAGLAIALMFGLVAVLGGTVAVGTSIRSGSAEEIGKIFFGEYIFPFEMALLLLLVAMIGVIVVARRSDGKEAL